MQLIESLRWAMQSCEAKGHYEEARWFWDRMCFHANSCEECRACEEHHAHS